MNRSTSVRAGAIALAAAVAISALVGLVWLTATASADARSVPAAAIAPLTPGMRPDPAGTPATTDAVASASGGISITVEVRSVILGGLSIAPATVVDTTEITVTTPAPCAAPSDSFSVLLGRADESSASLVTLAGPTAEGFSTTAPVTVRLDRTLREAGAELGAPLPAGTYRLVLVCIERASNTASGMFVAPLHLTDPTADQTTEPTATPTTPASPTTSLPATATSEPSTIFQASAGGGSTSSGGAVAYTGAPVQEMFLTGLLLAGLGVVFLLAGRRRVDPTPIEEG